MRHTLVCNNSVLARRDNAFGTQVRHLNFVVNGSREHVSRSWWSPRTTVGDLGVWDVARDLIYPRPWLWTSSWRACKDITLIAYGSQSFTKGTPPQWPHPTPLPSPPLSPSPQIDEVEGDVGWVLRGGYASQLPSLSTWHYQIKPKTFLKLG